MPVTVLTSTYRKSFSFLNKPMPACQVASVVSDSVRPHPWHSPGKNTGVGCHFLLQCRKVKVKSLSRIRLFRRSLFHQAPPSIGFSRQEYWSGVPLPSPSISLGPLFRLFWKDFFFKFLMQLDFPSFYLDFLHLFLYIDK